MYYYSTISIDQSQYDIRDLNNLIMFYIFLIYHL